MSKKRTQEEYIREVASVNPNVEILGEYRGANERVLCRCKLDDYVWSPPARNLLRGYGCPRCVGREHYTTQSFIEKLALSSPTIEVTTEYNGSDKRMGFRCKECGYNWLTSPGHVLRQESGCPNCSGVAHKSLDQLVDELRVIQPNVVVSGEYTNNKSRLKCRCILCGREWESSPNALLRMRGCTCLTESYGEKKVRRFLESHNIFFKTQHRFGDCIDSEPLRFDFYLPDENIAIEYDGQQHFYPVSFGCRDNERVLKMFEDCKRRDAIKNAYCLENNITLIRIPYTDFNRIEEILTDKLIA